MTTRRMVVAAVVGLAAVLGTLSTAWACTGQPQVFSVSPVTAPVGAEVTMRGTGVTATTPVELRWNGVSGPVLAQATPDKEAAFAMTFTVPNVEPGVYSLVVVTNVNGVAAAGRTTFEVSGAGATAVRAPALADTGFAAAAEAASLSSPAGTGSSSSMLAGVGLLAFASVALGGLVVATLRRRPALASGASDQ